MPDLLIFTGSDWAKIDYEANIKPTKKYLIIA